LTSGDRFKPIAEKVGKTPAWLFHGAQDPIVQVSESRGLVAALEANGGNVKYSEYPNVGHNVWLNAFGETELIPWLLSQKSD
jgi:predicted esterase